MVGSNRTEAKVIEDQYITTLTEDSSTVNKHIQIPSDDENFISIPEITFQLLEEGSVQSDMSSLTEEGTTCIEMTGSSRTEGDKFEADRTVNGDSKSITISSRPRQKELWDGQTTYSIKEVYAKNIVELENKDTAAAISKVMSQIIFSKMKFSPNWDYDCVWPPYHDKAKDEGYINVIFERMGWEFADDERKTLQAIKWNTYRDCAKFCFNAYRAARIAQVNKTLVPELVIFQAGVADNRPCSIRNLVKYMPKTLKGYYASDKTRVTRGDRQEAGLVEKLLQNEDAYSEFMKNVITGITGIKKMNEMCESGATYESVVTRSDEAFGLLLLEDKSLLWREVARKRRIGPFRDDGKSLGMEVDLKIKDKYGDHLTLYSNGGIMSPDLQKGWSIPGIQQYNVYMRLLKEFRESEYGKEALKKQRRSWKMDSRSTVKEKKRKMEINNLKAEGIGRSDRHVEFDDRK